jgi:hypothetical protein
MSVPAPSSINEQSGITSPIIGQINFGWISESWRFFAAQMGIWVTATLILAAPTVIFLVIFYGMMWATMFPTGFSPPTYTPAVQPPGGHGFPAPLTPGVAMNSRMAWMYPAEIGFGLVYLFWSSYLYGGMFRMAVRQVRGLSIEIRDIFRGGALFGRMLGAMFLLVFSAYFLEAVCLGPAGLLIWKHGPTAAIIVAGVVGVLLLIALLLAANGVLMPTFALMADGDGVFAALKRSIRAMQGHWASAAGFAFVLGVLVYASELPCAIGLLATIPMVFLVCALAYRDMIGMPNMVPPPAPFYAPADAGVWPPAPAAPQANSAQDWSQAQERPQERN